MQTAEHLIATLIKDRQPNFAVSIYMPTHPKTTSQTLNEDTTRFKNALKEIKQHALYTEREFGETLSSLYELADDIQFWKTQTRGLALFADNDGYQMCHLPYETVEALYVEERFVISPLVVMQSIDTDFCVLDVNATKPRLLASNDGTLVELDLKDMPDSFQESGAREEYKPELQHLNAPRGGGGGDNKFHGHGVKEALEHDMSEYLTMVAKSVDAHLKDHKLPLVIAGEQSRAGNLRPHVTYKYLIDTGVDGNFETHSLQELYDAVLPKIREFDNERQNELVKELAESAPDIVAIGNQDISSAAKEGRVKRMYVPAYRLTADSVIAGVKKDIILQLTDDIVNLEVTIRDVLSQAGEIQAVEIDSEVDDDIAEAKALCRYAL